MKNLFKFCQRNFFVSTMYKKAEVPQVFIELKQKGKDSQKLKVKLFEDINPQTTENFQKLCEGYTNSKGQTISYKNKKFVNNYPGFFMELEEIPETIFGESMHNESYDIQFNQPGLIGMSRTNKVGDEKSSSGFFIALNEIDFLDQYVAVGKIVEGFEGLKNLDLNEEIKIVNCGYDKHIPINNQQSILNKLLNNFFHHKIILKIFF